MSYAAGLPFFTNANLSLAEQSVTFVSGSSYRIVSSEFCKSIYRVFTDFGNNFTNIYLTAFITAKIIKPMCVLYPVCRVGVSVSVR
jgi:hypothetical protein